MSCQEIQERLPELLYGGLGGPEQVTLRSHLDACERCRGEWAALERTHRLLDTSAPLPSLGMVDRVMAAIEGERQPVGLLARLDLWIQRVSRHRPTRASWTFATVLTMVLLMPVLYPNLVRYHSEGASAACRTNLRVLSTALDRYADDHRGHYPARLGELVPRYVHHLPRCPVAGNDTYSPGYAPTTDFTSFRLECYGDYHPGQPSMVGSPALTH